jgi:ubiquinone biosynthesis accessory factor UbiJ
MFEQVFLAALDHLLGGANWAQNRLKPFAGRCARIEMPPITFMFEITAGGRVQPSPAPNLSDVTIRLPSDTPFLLLQGMDKVMSRAMVDGNAEFATELSFVFRNLRWDAEQDLSRWVGDITAHRLVQGASRFTAWQMQAATNLAENLTEYFTQENPLLTTLPEFSSFQGKVARLTADLARLEERSNSLKSLA